MLKKEKNHRDGTGIMSANKVWIYRSFSNEVMAAIIESQSRGGGGGKSHMKQTGMPVVSLRVFRASGNILCRQGLV